MSDARPNPAAPAGTGAAARAPQEPSGPAAETAAFPKIKKRRQGPYSSADCTAAPPPELLKGIHEFNAGEFFEQHETLELLWRATESDVRYLYQGILLVGVGFYHLEQGNFHGAQAKLSAGLEMLAWFTPACQTVDVADLIARTRSCLERVRALGPDRLSEFERALIPQVRLRA